MSNEAIAQQTKAARSWLFDHGWTQISEAGDMASPEGTVWFSTGYAHGEYTFHASYRRNGSGPAVQPVKIRITQATVDRRPTIGVDLVENLHELVAQMDAFDDREKVWREYPLVLWLAEGAA